MGYYWILTIKSVGIGQRILILFAYMLTLNWVAIASCVCFFPLRLGVGFKPRKTYGCKGYPGTRRMLTTKLLEAFGKRSTCCFRVDAPISVEQFVSSRKDPFPENKRQTALRLFQSPRRNDPTKPSRHWSRSSRGSNGVLKRRGGSRQQKTSAGETCRCCSMRPALMYAVRTWQVTAKMCD